MCSNCSGIYAEGLDGVWLTERDRHGPVYAVVEPEAEDPPPWLDDMPWDPHAEDWPEGEIEQ